MRRVLAREFDLVYLNQLQYLSAHEAAGYQALAKMCEDGECTIRAAIIVRADSGISSPADLRGRTIAFGDPRAMVSRILAQAVLRQSGLRPGEYRAIFARNPHNVLLAMYNGMADTAGISPSVLDHPEITKRVDLKSLRVIAESQPIPHLPIAVRGDLPAAMKQHILQALTTLAERIGGREALRQLGIDRFAPADDAEYQAIHRLLNGEGGGEGS
jgi:phosphonate transport system substrate-binding protein